MVLKKVEDFIVKHQLVKAGDKVLLAISGGPDSMALLHVFLNLREKFALSLHVAHLNHLIRVEEYTNTANFVKEYAEQLGLPTTVESENAVEYCQKHKLSLEDGARIIRYRYLNRVAQEVKADKIAVGHHADDQAETFLLHLFRGSGLKGLTGILPERDKIIRPLLPVTRMEIMDYCHRNKIENIMDSSNLEDIVTRNKVRLNLMPQLKEYNPQIIKVLNTTAEIIRIENDFVEEAAEAAFQAISFVAEKEISLNLEDFLKLHQALQRRLIIKVYETLWQGIHSLNYAYITKIEEFIQSKLTAKKLNLPNETVLQIKNKSIIFSKSKKSRKEFKSYEIKIPLEGKVDLPAEKLILSKIVSLADLGDNYKNASPNRAYLDLNKTGKNLFIRNRRPGDVFKPLGLNKNKKLKDFLIDLKVEQEQRDNLPLLINEKGEIIWVSGLRISDDFKLTTETKEVLYLELFSK